MEITGSYDLQLTTPDGRLSANASAGSPTDLSVVLKNGGHRRHPGRDAVRIDPDRLERRVRTGDR